MLFSIIIPVYNSEHTIRRCINSILSQNFGGFEIIVIDDGSTDKTLEILEAYSAKDSRIKVFHFENAGVSVSRQRGISLASGDYLLFADSDDSVNPELLFNLNSAIENFGNPDIIRYQCKLIGDAAHKNHERYNFETSLDVPMTGMEALKTWSTSGKKYAVYWLFAFKKDVFTNVSLLPGLKCYEDVALIPVLIAKSKQVLVINFCGYNYYCSNANSLSNKSSMAAEKSRAIDFWKAYIYAISNFIKIENISESDIMFFVADYNKRLKSKFNSLDENLKKELFELYNF